MFQDLRLRLDCCIAIVESKSNATEASRPQKLENCVLAKSFLLNLILDVRPLKQQTFLTEVELVMFHWSCPYSKFSLESASSDVQNFFNI